MVTTASGDFTAGTLKESRKYFFFEEQKQKTFASAPTRRHSKLAKYAT